MPESMEQNAETASLSKEIADSYRARIKKWLDVQLEKKAKNEHYDAHADRYLNPDHLTEKDIKILARIDNGTITSAELMELRNEIITGKPEDKNSGEYKKWESRDSFYLWAANLAGIVIGFREIGIKKSIDL